MKKLLVLLLTLTLVTGLAGCVFVEESVVIAEDGSGTINTTILVEKEAYEYLMVSMAEQGYSPDIINIFEGREPETVTIEDIDFYYISEEQTFNALEELEDVLSSEYEEVYVSENGIRFIVQQEIDDMSYEEVQEAYDEIGLELKNIITGIFQFTMPHEIIKCSDGGEISEDGLTASFTVDFEQMCKGAEIMLSTAEEDEKPSMSVVHKKTYKNAKTVAVEDESGIKEAKYKKKDGKYYNFSRSHTFIKNGTYTVTAKDYYGNRRTRTFTLLDETKPKVKGVTNKKTYTSGRSLTFSDNCAISSVTLYIDGQKTRLSENEIEMGILAVKPAEYKIFIKDVNGNSRTVRFTIK